MRSLLDIKLPLQGTMKVKGDDMKILDHLWEMDIPDLNKYLAKVHDADMPVIMVLNVPRLGFVGLFLYRPPDIWLDFNDQKYQLFISPNLPMLHHHWVDRRMRTQDIFEVGVTTKIIEFIELNMKQQSSVSTT